MDYQNDAYAIVTEHIQWALPIQERVRAVLLGTLNQGSWAAKKQLEPVWPEPEEFSWPAATEFLNRTKKRVKPMDYAELLRLTVARVAYRMERREQVLLLYESRVSRKTRGYVFIGDRLRLDSPTECGIQGGQVYKADDFIANPPPVCTVVGCQCNIDTWREKDLEEFRQRHLSH